MVRHFHTARVLDELASAPPHRSACAPRLQRENPHCSAGKCARYWLGDQLAGRNRKKRAERPVENRRPARVFNFPDARFARSHAPNATARLSSSRPKV